MERLDAELLSLLRMKPHAQRHKGFVTQQSTKIDPVKHNRPPAAAAHSALFVPLVTHQLIRLPHC